MTGVIVVVGEPGVTVGGTRRQRGLRRAGRDPSGVA